MARCPAAKATDQRGTARLLLPSPLQTCRSVSCEKDHGHPHDQNGNWRSRPKGASTCRHVSYPSTDSRHTSTTRSTRFLPVRQQKGDTIKVLASDGGLDSQSEGWMIKWVVDVRKELVTMGFQRHSTTWSSPSSMLSRWDRQCPPTMSRRPPRCGRRCHPISWIRRRTFCGSDKHTREHRGGCSSGLRHHGRLPAHRGVRAKDGAQRIKVRDEGMALGTGAGNTTSFARVQPARWAKEP